MDLKLFEVNQTSKRLEYALNVRKYTGESTMLYLVNTIY